MTLWHLGESPFASGVPLPRLIASYRYCDAITATLRMNSRGSPYYTSILTDQLKDLIDRLTGAPLDKNASWTKKMTKPSLDTIGTWVGGRLTKFIAGDGDEPPDAEADKPTKVDKTGFVGPFSHYSTISSETSSLTPSPTNSYTNLPSLHPPKRSGSAMAATRGPNPLIQIDRASSAADFLRPTNRRLSDVPQVFSASAATTSFFQADAGFNSFAKGRQQAKDAHQGQSVDYWPPGEEDFGATPTANSFNQGEEEPASEGQFVSLMEAYSPMPSPGPATFGKQHNNGSAKPPLPSKLAQTSRQEEEDDDEDLGFGNSKNKKKPKSPVDESEESETDADQGSETETKKASPAKPGV